MLLLLAVAPSPAQQPPRITTPKEEFGHDFGEDYFLANYKQLSDYWRKLDSQSDRMTLHEIGRTSEGRPHLMAIVTSPANHRNLERYRQTSMRLALADGVSEEEARVLAREGKAVVWIDGGLHANEILGAQQLGEMVYQMVSRTDPETMRFLDEVIILFVHANPDGHDLVADWYMRVAEPTRRSTAGIPRLYHQYIGHDNNRDFFMSTQVETENISRVLYHQWMPQVLYNHHQSGPAGTVVWTPPLRDPYNYNLDPIVVLGYQQLGSAMHARLAVEGKPGATMRTGGPYDGWWNGGIRNTASFHNVIALLTEMIGNPTPMRLPLVMNRQVPTLDNAFPVPPQTWHFRQSVDYSIALNRAVIDYAARNRENLLFNIYTAASRSIARGRADTWTANPRRMATITARMGAPTAENERRIWDEFHKPEMRDPRGYIIPADQADFPTATKFINALREVNVAVQRATADFTVGTKRYPRGSYVVMTAQAFRPHVMDMFEAQQHPDVFPVPGGPPTPPYDHAGWTLAMQMGVKFDRILDPFTGPFEPVTEWNAKPIAGTVAGAARPAGYTFSRVQNDAFVAVNKLVAAGESVYSLERAVTERGDTLPAGTFYVRARPSTRRLLDSLAAGLGVSFRAVATAETRNTTPVRPLRIGLWDQYGGSMDSGWARWLMDQYAFPFTRVFPQELDAGNLRAKFDVILFVGGGIPAAPRPGAAGGGGGGFGGQQPAPESVPEEFRAHLGRVTHERTLPQLKAFMEAGGTVLAIGSSAPSLASFLALPVGNHMVDEQGRDLPETVFYTPGSVLSARWDTTHPIARGMEERTNVFFDDSPVFRFGPGAEAAGLKRIAWFDSPNPLRSGWSWGESRLENGIAVFEAPVGRGRAVFYGPEVLKRGQPHGTFKAVFNGLIGAR